MASDWLKAFEEKYDLNFFEQKNVSIKRKAYFEKTNHFEWFIEIDENKKTITLPKFNLNSYRESELKEKQIIGDLLENISNWNIIGLSNCSGGYEVSKITPSNDKYIIHYAEKESINAFGYLDWDNF